MRQAIITRYLGPTDHRGARVKATAQAGSVTVPWDHAWDVSANHVEAAMTLAKKFGWHGVLAGGGLPDDTGYAFAFADQPDLYMGLVGPDWHPGDLCSVCRRKKQD